VQFLLENWNWVWVVTALASGGMLAWPALTRGAGGNGVSPAEAVRLMNREKAVVVDVSEPGEFALGHLIGARNIQLALLDASRDLPTNKALPVILVCASGNRASRAAKALLAKGHTGAVVLGGGLSAWKAANLPLETLAKKTA